jgi:hypothetical protein
LAWAAALVVSLRSSLPVDRIESDQLRSYSRHSAFATESCKMSLSIDFTGQTVIVTGAATGLGFATAEAFGQAGARLALNDLTPERVEGARSRLAARGIDATGFPADIRDAAAVRRMVDAAWSMPPVPRSVHPPSWSPTPASTPTPPSWISPRRNGTASSTRT